MSLKPTINCKEASFLISKQQETTLSLYEKLQLRLHLSVCDACRLFQIQTNSILKLLRQNKQKPYKSLSQHSKRKLQELLNHERNL